MALIETRLIAAAADMWSGADPIDLAANPEYLRGQVELIVNTATDWHPDDDRETLHVAVDTLLRSVIATGNEREWEEAQTPMLRLAWNDTESRYDVEPVQEGRHRLIPA